MINIHIAQDRLPRPTHGSVSFRKSERTPRHPAQTYARVTQYWGEFRQEAPTIWKHWPLLLPRWQRVMTFFRIWITYQSSINSSGGKENPCRTPLTVKVSIYSSPVHFTQKTKYLKFSCFKRFMVNCYDIILINYWIFVRAQIVSHPK